jgi:hypothetical protein
VVVEDAAGLAGHGRVRFRRAVGDERLEVEGVAHLEDRAPEVAQEGDEVREDAGRVGRAVEDVPDRTLELGRPPAPDEEDGHEQHRLEEVALQADERSVANGSRTGTVRPRKTTRAAPLATASSSARRVRRTRASQPNGPGKLCAALSGGSPCRRRNQRR